MKAKFVVLIICLWGSYQANAQSCSGKEKDELVQFNENQGVKISACIHGAHTNKIGYSQDVSWAVKNMTGQKIEVHFVKVYTFSNGTVKKKSVDFGKTGVIVKPNETAKGGNFSGDLSLNDNFFKEDCNCPGEDKRVVKLEFENLRVEKAK